MEGSCWVESEGEREYSGEADGSETMPSEGQVIREVAGEF